jgi:hypothetical protein
MEKINLGVSMKEEYGCCGMQVAQPPPMEAPDELRFPSFTYSGPEKLGLPDEGTMTVCFKKTSETSSIRQGGKKWYECRVEVKCICEVEGKEEDEVTSPTSRDTSAEDALDALAKAVGKRNSEHH